MAWNDTIEFRKVDQKTIKSLSSETRVDMLKSLSKRRKMPAELAKELGMAPSTIVEHLRELEDSGLVKKQQTQHKWIYYELTEKGSELFSPKIPFQFILMLAFGIIIAGLSFWNYSSIMTMPVQYSTEQVKSAPTADASEGSVVMATDRIVENQTQAQTTASNTPDISIIIGALGIALAAYASYLIYKAKIK
jgi:DNA-binding transcriptional ArsR family regulator